MGGYEERNKDMIDALIVLKNNLKNNTWHVNPHYRIDENEAIKLIEEIEEVEKTEKEDDGK